MDINAIFETFKDIISTWFSVITRGRKAFEKLDLEKSSTLIYALKFMFLMAFVGLIIDLPLAAKIGSTLKVMAIPPLLVAEAYIEYLAIALILHGSMKLVGGKGVYQTRDRWDKLSTWDHFSFALSFLLATVVFVLFFAAVFRQFRALHQLRKPRAVFAFIGGLVASAVILSMFLEPPLSVLLRELAR